MLLESPKGTSSREIALEIVGNLNARWSLDLLPILSNEALSVEARRKLLTARLLEAAFSDIDEYNRREGIDADPGEGAALLARFTGEVADAEVETELEPNISVTQHNFEIIRNYRGQEVYDYVYTLSKRLESMSNAKSVGQLAIEISSGGLFSVGVAMAKLTWTAWRAGATFLNALRTGITTIGMKTAIAVIIVVLVAFLLYLFLENPKKILGIVFNDTDENFVVDNWRQGIDGGTGADVNLYMAHGTMENFMQDRADGNLDSPIIQVRQRFFFEAGDPENVIFGGVYFADRNFGLRGSEGVMVFSSLTNGGVKFAHQFAVPYTNDNGTNMQLISGARPLMPDLFRTMYDNRKVRVDFAQDGYRLVSTVNDPRGGVVGLIASISKL